MLYPLQYCRLITVFIFLQHKKISENYDTTVKKLEECRELLKTNENGEYLSRLDECKKWCNIASFSGRYFVFVK